MTFAAGLGSLPLDIGVSGRHFSPLDFQSRAAEMSPSLPYLAEAPSRGAGADMIGRSLAMASAQSRDFAATTIPTGWKLSTPGRDMERALAWLSADRDAFCEVVAEHSGDVKVQLAGPYTVAACVENTAATRMVGDRAFIAELAQVLAAAARGLVSDITRQTSAHRVIVQFDEPMLPMVLGGSLPTASGFSRHTPVAATDVLAVLTALVDECGSDADTLVWFHCCAANPPLELFAGAGAQGLSATAGHLGNQDLEILGKHIDDGGTLALGVLDPADWQALPPAALKDRAVTSAEALRHKLGFGEQVWSQALILTPSCGLAGATARQAAAVMNALNQAATSLAGGRIAPEGL